MVPGPRFKDLDFPRPYHVVMGEILEFVELHDSQQLSARAVHVECQSPAQKRSGPESLDRFYLSGVEHCSGKKPLKRLN